MPITLFTKSYHKDIPWLNLATQSVAKKAQEDVFWTIVCDKGESDQFMRGVELMTKPSTITFKLVEIQQYWPEASELGGGYIQQQWVKMNAHKVMGTDYFLNWDSDVMAIKDFTRQDFLGKSGRPIMWFTPFNDITVGEHVKVHMARRDFMRNVFNNIEISFEWMRCMPIWMNGEILRVGSTRDEWERVKILCRSRVEGMSEFNVIGQLSHLYFPDAYEWKNTANSEPTWGGNIIQQFWSWGYDIASAKKVIDAL